MSNKWNHITAAIVKFFSGKDMPISSDKIHVRVRALAPSDNTWHSMPLLEYVATDADGMPIHNNEKSKNPHKAKFVSETFAAQLLSSPEAIDLLIGFAKAGKLKADNRKSKESVTDTELLASALAKLSASPKKRLSAAEKTVYRAHLESQLAKLS